MPSHGAMSFWGGSGDRARREQELLCTVAAEYRPVGGEAGRRMRRCVVAPDARHRLRRGLDRLQQIPHAELGLDTEVLADLEEGPDDLRFGNRRRQSPTTSPPNRFLWCGQRAVHGKESLHGWRQVTASRQNDLGRRMHDMACTDLFGEVDEVLEVIEVLRFRETEGPEVLRRIGWQRGPGKERVNPEHHRNVRGAERPDTFEPVGNARSSGVPEGPGVVAPEGQAHFDLDRGVIERRKPVRHRVVGGEATERLEQGDVV